MATISFILEISFRCREAMTVYYGPKSLQTVAASSCEIRSHDNKIPLATENELLYFKIFNFVTDHEWPPAARYF